MKEGDEITYHHAKDSSSFHEDRRKHPAIVTRVMDDKTVDLSILNDDGLPTIPISDVPHKSTKGRDKDSAHWD